MYKIYWPLADQRIIYPLPVESVHPQLECRHPQRNIGQWGVLGKTNVIPATRFNNLWFQRLHAHYYGELSCRNQNYRSMYLVPSLTNFIFAKTMQLSAVLCVSKFQRNGQICRFQKAKSVSVRLQGGLWPGALPCRPPLQACIPNFDPSLTPQMSTSVETPFRWPHIKASLIRRASSRHCAL